MCIMSLTCGSDFLWQVDRILEVIERTALRQLDAPFALEDGVRVVLSMPRLWARCISLLLRVRILRCALQFARWMAR